MKEELTQLRSIAHRYVIEHLHRFDPINWQAHEKSELRRKAFTELGMYHYVRQQDGRSDPEVEDFILEKVNSPDFRELLRRYPGLLRQNALSAILMAPTGKLEPATVRALDDAVRDRRLWGKERRPHQLIDLLVQCRLWGYDGHDHELSSVLEMSNLVHQPPVIVSDITEYYRLTHNVMLPTLFGFDHPDLFDAPLPYDVETSATGAMLKCMARGNADALLEFLVVGAIQDQLPDRLMQQALEWVYQEKVEDGHVVAPNIEDSERDNADKGTRSPVEEWGPETRHWAKHYHTNLVAGIAASVLENNLDLSRYDAGDVSLDSEEFRNDLALGRALNQLESYDLAAATDTLASLPGQTFDRYPEIARRIVTFLEDQRTGDSYGYWVDERRLYEQTTGDESDFKENLVDPISEDCREIVDDISSHLSPTSP